MKSILLIALLFVTSAGTSAQDYLLSFSASGQSTSIADIKVTNLNQGTSLVIDGSKLLQLVNTITGVNAQVLQKNKIHVYPNPMHESASLSFFNNQKGGVVISVFNIAGEKVASANMYLDKGFQTFVVDGLATGVYALSITTPLSSYSAKIISTSNSGNNARIEYLSSEYTTKSGILNTNHKQDNVVQMQYNQGDRLKFEAFATEGHKRVETMVPTESQNINFEFVECIDSDGNYYGTVTIGEQTWMAENLKVVTTNSSVYPGATAEYGRLYDWGEASSVCPAGWHLPNDEEWTTLTTLLGGEAIAGKKLKEAGTTNWLGSNTGTNETGFTALPGGGFFNYYGTHANMGEFGYWWSSTQVTEPGFENNAMIRNMKNISNYCNRIANYKGDRLSIRCIK